MTTHSSILVWRIPWTGRLAGPWLPSRGRKESDMTERLSMHTCSPLVVPFNRPERALLARVIAFYATCSTVLVCLVIFSSPVPSSTATPPQLSQQHPPQAYPDLDRPVGTLTGCPAAVPLAPANAQGLDSHSAWR